MLAKFTQQLSSGFYYHGGIWQFDWYLDEIFCQAMAFGRHPVFLGFYQPILGDEFLNPSNSESIKLQFRHYLTNPPQIAALISSQNRILKHARDFLNHLKIDPSTLNFKNYYQIQSDLSLLMASISLVFDDLITQKLEQIATKAKIPLYDLTSYIIDQSSHTQLAASNHHLLKLFKSNPHISANDLISHAQTFGWLNTSERGHSSWTKQDFYLQLQELIKKSPAPNKAPRLTKSTQLLVDQLITINLNDNQASDLQVELDFYFQQFLKNHLGQNYNESIIQQLTFAEITSLVEEPNQIIEFIDRKNNYSRLLYPYQGQTYSYYLPSQQYLELTKLVNNPPPTKMLIRGCVACQGKATGIVRLIKTYQDLELFQSGEILVATQTQPNYTPFMIKAKAIITDIGGITSHAAIISREFNLPCIVGTQNATAILKTGDQVHVDAITGQVTIIL